MRISDPTKTVGFSPPSGAARSGGAPCGLRRRATLAALLFVVAGCAESDPVTTDDAGTLDGLDGAEDVEAVDDHSEGSADDASLADDGAGSDDAATGEDGSGTCTTPDSLAPLWGNGGFAITGNWSWARMAVRVTGCGGVPVVGASVSWEVLDTIGVMSEDITMPPSTTLTTSSDGEGVARAVFRCPSSMSNPSDSADPGRVRIVSGGRELEYLVTVFNSCPIAGCSSSPPMSPQMLLVVPEGRDLGTLRVGDTVAGGIQVQVANATGWEMGRPAPNIGVRIVDPADGGADFVPSPALRCVGEAGIVLTDATGLATCDLQVLGAGASARVLVGENTYWDVRFTIGP